MLITRTCFLWNFKRNCRISLVLIKGIYLIYFSYCELEAIRVQFCKQQLQFRSYFYYRSSLYCDFCTAVIQYSLLSRSTNKQHIHIYIFIYIYISNILYKQNRSVRIPEDDADTLKRVGGVLTIHKILFIYIYIYIYIYICVCVCVCVCVRVSVLCICWCG